ncbi:MAG: hypothetical protein ACFFCW_49405, partial [Candidatus Hodarchaeota archaeon]
MKALAQNPVREKYGVNIVLIVIPTFPKKKDSKKYQQPKMSRRDIQVALRFLTSSSMSTVFCFRA